MAAITRQDDTFYYYATTYGYPPELDDYFKNVAHEPGQGSVIGRTILHRKTIHVQDVLADAEYTMAETAQKAKIRTALGVPLLREGNPIGVILVGRHAVQPFTDRQIDLVETFADQAVIAIENVRLFDEVQARTHDLAESLQQQTATADVLKAISRSTFDLQTVLNALIESAARLCNADQGAITREINGAFFRAATYGHSSEFSDFIRNTPVQLDRSSIVGRALVEGRIVHIPDVQARSRIHLFAGTGSGRLSHGPWRSDAAGGGANRCPGVVAQGTFFLLPTNKSSWSRPSPTRRRSRSKTFACSKVSRHAHAN